MAGIISTLAHSASTTRRLVSTLSFAQRASSARATLTALAELARHERLLLARDRSRRPVSLPALGSPPLS